MYRIQRLTTKGKLVQTTTREDWDAFTAREAYAKAIRNSYCGQIRLQFTASKNLPWSTVALTVWETDDVAEEMN